MTRKILIMLYFMYIIKYVSGYLKWKKPEGRLASRHKRSMCIRRKR